MTYVALMTLSGVFQGDLYLESPIGQPVRLLDALNQPHRLKKLTIRAAPCLGLSNAVRRDLHGKRVECGDLIGIRAEEVLVAYEVTLDTDEEGGPSTRVYEQRQEWRDGEVVHMFLENGFRLTGEVGGGLNMVDMAKPGRQFVLCRDVRLLAPGSETALELPYVAVNGLRIEGSGLGNPW